jgi:hypothetical protein
MENTLTIQDAIDKFQHNPEAAALAVGMMLLQKSQNEINQITKSIEERQEERIKELEKELDFWIPLGKKWLTFQKLIAPPTEPLC